MQRQLAFPKPTPIVIGTLVALFAVWVISSMATKFSPGLASVVSYLPLSQAPVMEDFQVWRLLTYALLHDTSSIFHLLFNGLMLWWFGSELEKRWGKPRFIFFMLLAALVGGLFFLVGSLIGVVWAQAVIGASAIAEATIVAWSLIYRDRTILLFFVLPIRAIHMVWFAIGFAVLDGISTSNVSAAAHFGGIFVGFIMALGLWKTNRMKLAWDNVLTFLRIRKKPNLYVVPKPKGPDKYNVH
jgi:membrane associated rhomboid family serine protease